MVKRHSLTGDDDGGRRSVMDNDDGEEAEFDG